MFEEYFTELNEESIRDNFVITYEVCSPSLALEFLVADRTARPLQLLDEMMDFGYPQSTEAKVLKE